VSDQGRVRSFITKGPGRIVSDIPQRILRLRVDRYGYPKATLLTDRKHTTYSVHRMVALAFHGSPPDPSLVVRHLDGDTSNNRANNLQWGTQRENALDRRTHGTQVCGSGHPSAVLNEDDVRRIRAAYEAGALSRDLAAMYHVTAANIRHVCTGRNWKHVDGPITIRACVPSAKDAPHARLTWEEVDQIRKRLAAGDVGVALAREFSVSEGCISAIKCGWTWRDEH